MKDKLSVYMIRDSRKRITKFPNIRSQSIKTECCKFFKIAILKEDLSDHDEEAFEICNQIEISDEVKKED